VPPNPFQPRRLTPRPTPKRATNRGLAFIVSLPPRRLHRSELGQLAIRNFEPRRQLLVRRVLEHRVTRALQLFPFPLFDQKLVALSLPGGPSASAIRKTLASPKCRTMQSLQAATELACDVEFPSSQLISKGLRSLARFRSSGSIAIDNGAGVWIRCGRSGSRTTECEVLESTSRARESRRVCRGKSLPGGSRRSTTKRVCGHLSGEIQFGRFYQSRFRKQTRLECGPQTLRAGGESAGCDRDSRCGRGGGGNPYDE